nr:hypothetical protein StreXyl84_00740 [Streptomyces sp. Xyl84]
MHAEEALMYDPNADDTRRDQVLRAVAVRPGPAILVDRREARHAPPKASPP